MTKTILVFGATGRVGGAAARHLHDAGWHVRAVTRNLDSDAAQKLAKRGIEVRQGNLKDPVSLRPSFADVYGVFLLLNGWESSFEEEVKQGQIVAKLAKEANVQHLVFSAAGIGKRGTAVAHFESKVDVIDHIQREGVPLTTIFPPPFMELMTDSDMYPNMVMWHAKRKSLGKDFNIPWIATDDIGAIAVTVFAEPDVYIGQRIDPVGDWKTVDECAHIYQALTGKAPPKMPIPMWVLRRMIPELFHMWAWMREQDLPMLLTHDVDELCPQKTDVRTFLHNKLRAT